MPILPQKAYKTITLSDNETKLEIISVTETSGKDFQAEVVFKVPFTEIVHVRKQLTGGVQSSDRRHPPALYREELGGEENTPGNPASVEKVTVNEWFGDGAGRTVITNSKAEPEFVKMKAIFKTPSWIIGQDLGSGEEGGREPSDFMITEKWVGNAEFLTGLPDGLFWRNPAQFPDAPLPLTQKEAPGIIKRKGTWTVTTHLMLIGDLIEIDFFSDKMGTVNKFSLYSPRFKYTFVPETLIFGAPTLVQRWTDYGYHYDVTFHMSNKQAGRVPEGKPNGWNLKARRGEEFEKPMWRLIVGGGEEGEDLGVYHRIYERHSYFNWLPRGRDA